MRLARRRPLRRARNAFRALVRNPVGEAPVKIVAADGRQRLRLTMCLATGPISDIRASIAALISASEIFSRAPAESMHRCSPDQLPGGLPEQLDFGVGFDLPAQHREQSVDVGGLLQRLPDDQPGDRSQPARQSAAQRVDRVDGQAGRHGDAQRFGDLNSSGFGLATASTTRSAQAWSGRGEADCRAGAPRSPCSAHPRNSPRSGNGPRGFARAPFARPRRSRARVPAAGSRWKAGASVRSLCMSSGSSVATKGFAPVSN